MRINITVRGDIVWSITSVADGQLFRVERLDGLSYPRFATSMHDALMRIDL